MMLPEPLTPEYLTSPAIPARHGFFTRRGGTSRPPYDSLNCSTSSADDPAAVAANRDAARQSLGATTLLGLTQVHGTEVVTVTTPWPAGAGPRADAMVCALPGLALGIVTADCAPVLFHDPCARVIAAAHAGWRGALAGILEATIAAMTALGATAPNIAAAIGPTIAQSSYEVGPDLIGAILAHNQADASFLAPHPTSNRPTSNRPGHLWFDLPGYCAARLAAAGITRIDRLGLDTASDPERFFSHRRRTLHGGGPIGHMLSAITL